MSAGPISSPSHQEALLTDGAVHERADGNVELNNLAAQQSSLPVEQDLMQLARLGEIGAIQRLFDEGKCDATYKDDQGITPLHWAAINNHIALCHFLIENGADVNAKGGDAVATPVLWAAKRCHYYIVNLLLQHGADPLLTDDQGFNLLHSATLDGNVFQLVLLLHLDIPIDIADAQGHTSLMWASYKGFPACVDLFLRWGANVYARDDQGFTALHWALVKGAQGPIQKLVEYGADRFAENNEGKTPAVTAEDMNTQRQWHRALTECGYHKDGRPRYFPLSSFIKDRKSFMGKFFFLWPFVGLFCVLYILAHMVVFAALPIAAIVGYGLHEVAQQALKWSPPGMNHMHRTPFLAGIFAGSLFWVGVRWIFRVLPWTIKSHFFLNLLFAVCYGLCTYFYFSTMIRDPGYIPKLSSRRAQKAVIEELVEARKFDELNFCTHCMIRRPLRSKHCKRCGRCVAKEDHHCPWVDNCVAVNNHRHFVLYVLTMEVGVILFVRLILGYLEVLPNPKAAECNILNSQLCKTLNKDPLTILLTIWVALQLIWVTMLLVVQLVQVARAQTTYESMKGHLSNHDAGDAITSFVTTGSVSAQDGGAQSTNDNGAGPDPAAARPRRESFLQQWKRLLGIDTFLAVAVKLTGGRREGVNRPQRNYNRNPFNMGVVTNCRDFWCDNTPIFRGRENGEASLGRERVYYTSMYEPPRMVMRRQRVDGGVYEVVDTDDNV